MDLDAFGKWLLTQGVPEAHLPAYRQGAEKVLAEAGDGPVYPKHVDAALRKEEAAGAAAKRLANLQRIGELLVQFERASAPAPLIEGLAQVRCGACGRTQPATRAGTCVLCGKPIAAPRVGGVTRDADGTRRCRGCNGKFVYYDGLAAGGAGGGLAGTAAVAMVYWVGILGGITVGASIATLSTLVAALSLKFRCESCWERLPAAHLEPEEKSAMMKQRLIFLAVAIGLGVLAVAAGITWLVLGAKAGPRGRLRL